MNRRLWACQPSFCTDGSGPLFGTINLGLRDLQMNPTGYCGLDAFQHVVCNVGCVSKPSSHYTANFPDTLCLGGRRQSGMECAWNIAQWSVTNVFSTAGASGACPCSDQWMPFPFALGKPYLLWFILGWKKHWALRWRHSKTWACCLRMKDTAGDWEGDRHAH